VGLLSLLADPLRAHALAESGRAVALRSGDIDCNAERFARRLRDLAARRSRTPALSTALFRVVFLSYVGTRALGNRIMRLAVQR
jgi:hypothetical protein